MPSIAQIKDMLSSRPVGGGRGFVNPPMAKREPLEMPEDMEDQPPEAQIEEAERRRKMRKAYDKMTKQSYAKGGVTRADGCITKGHTKGRMV
jgi:hypothetical protein